jgi:amidophosphoribosyltransferase
LKDFLDFEAHRHINTDSDTELMLNIFANELQKTGKFRINEEDTFSALKAIYSQCRGGFACVAMIAGFGIIGFRDPNGIRPLIYGSRSSAEGTDYMFASESVALDVAGFTDQVDVQPGEAVIITRNAVTKRQLVPQGKFTPCMFEYVCRYCFQRISPAASPNNLENKSHRFVYFARPDSIIDGISVYKARLAMGETLAQAVVRKFGAEKVDIDVVIPVPDTSRVSALQVSYKLGIIYREGFIKNRYIGRTFIMPGQTTRRINVRRKLNPMAMEFAGKNVLIVDGM